MYMCVNVYGDDFSHRLADLKRYNVAQPILLSTNICGRPRGHAASQAAVPVGRIQWDLVESTVERRCRWSASWVTRSRRSANTLETVCVVAKNENKTDGQRAGSRRAAGGTLACISRVAMTKDSQCCIELAINSSKYEMFTCLIHQSCMADIIASIDASTA